MNPTNLTISHYYFFVVFSPKFSPTGEVQESLHRLNTFLLFSGEFTKLLKDRSKFYKLQEELTPIKLHLGTSWYFAIDQIIREKLKSSQLWGKEHYLEMGKTKD